MDPIERIDVTKDTSFVFIHEAQDRGHQNYYCGISDLTVEAASVRVLAAPLNVKAVQGEHFEVGDYVTLAAEQFDAIFMRKDPPFDTDFFFATHVLSFVDASRTFVFNNPLGLREATEKLVIFHFPELIAESLVSARKQEILDFYEKVGRDIVVKPLDGCGGQGIFRIRDGDLNVHSILETITEDGRKQCMAQRFLPESREGDSRLIYLDGQPLGAIKRVPREDDLRGNIHVGGQCIRSPIGPREKKICERIEPTMNRLGLYFAGLDIIGEYLTEVNVTSPTGVQEVNELDGVKLEAQVIDFVESRCAELEGS